MINRLILKYLKLSSFVVMLILSFNPLYAQVLDANQNHPSNIKSTDVKASTNPLLEASALPINARILALFSKANFDTEYARSLLPQILQISENFNAAERYLIHIVQAKILSKDQQFKQAIELLKQAEVFEKSIITDQLNTPLFYQLHLDIADYYVKLNNYKLAFEQRKKYQEKYKEYLKQIKANKINKLEQKFNTDAKQKQNELLAAENKIKALEIEETEQTRELQIRNIIILICTSALFLTLIIRQYKITAKLKKLSRTDTLTGLMNRGSLFYLGQKLIEETIENQQTLSAVLFDIDQLKVINEQYGHLTGDKVIKTIASLGAETMRSRDLYARLGDEEFVAVLPEANVGEAKAIAQRLLDKITGHSFKTIGIDESLSASFGVVSIEQVDHDFDALIQAASMAMHQAKESGCSQVSLFKAKP